MHDRKVMRLIQRASRGDATAFAKLYDHFVDRVYGFVKLRVRDVRDAEELTESVFLKAYRSLPTFEDRGVPFAAWLFRIARNEVVDFSRRSVRAIPTSPPPDEDMAAETEVEALAIGRMDAQRVRDAVEMLTSEQAEVVVARFFWGLSVTETASAVGRSEGAVKALQHRATRTLARALGDEECGEEERRERAV